MKSVQVVLNRKLLKAADLAAKRQRVSQSALIRQALAHYLQYLRDSELEAQDRRGYLAKPQLADESRLWEAIASWPHSHAPH